jgi:Protein of unknown function (DUF4238)
VALPRKKHRQHHVWQHYLEPWTTKKKIFCLRAGKIFHPDTKNVAVERDFYKLQRLTNEDIAFLRLFVINVGPAYAKPMHEDFLRELLAPRAFVEQNRHKLKNAAEADTYLETQEINVLEDRHMEIESSFSTMLQQLRQGDISFYSNDDDCIMFARYIATQYMRSKGIKVRMIERFQQAMGVDISRLWDIASLIQSVNIGCSLFQGRKRQQLVLLRNNTDVAFITGDQPIINLHGGKRPTPPTELSMYYPVSPTAALIWGEVDEEVPYSTDTLTAAQVSAFNARIAAEAHSQTFAFSEHSLRPFL